IPVPLAVQAEAFSKRFGYLARQRALSRRRDGTTLKPCESRKRPSRFRAIFLNSYRLQTTGPSGLERKSKRGFLEPFGPVDSKGMVRRLLKSPGLSTDVLAPGR